MRSEWVMSEGGRCFVWGGGGGESYEGLVFISY